MKKNNTDRCSKAKQFPCSSMKGDVKSTRTLDETVIISGDLRFQQSGMATQCNYSSTLTLPITPMVEGDILAAPQMADSSSLWVSPYFILDSSKVENISSS